jgi:hypothetical protein
MVENVGYVYYSIFIFIPNIQILPAVSTAGNGLCNYALPTVETVGYVYYSIFFIPNIQILPAVSTAGHGIINISSQWLKPLAMFCKPNYDPYFLKKYKTKKMQPLRVAFSYR